MSNTQTAEITHYLKQGNTFWYACDKPRDAGDPLEERLMYVTCKKCLLEALSDLQYAVLGLNDSGLIYGLLSYAISAIKKEGA